MTEEYYIIETKLNDKWIPFGGKHYDLSWVIQIYKDLVPLTSTNKFRISKITREEIQLEDQQ